MERQELDALLDVLATMSDRLAETAAVVGEENATATPADGSFSLVEHVWHLADIESEAYAVRLRRLRQEDGPVLSDFEGSRLAKERSYRQRSLREGLDVFNHRRALNLETLAGVQDHEWARVGTQELMGTVCLGDVPRMMAEHDATHRAELEDLLKAMTPRPAEPREAIQGLLDRLSATIDELPRVIREFGEEALRRPPATSAVGVETLSAIGHLCHLRDIEVDGYRERIRRLRSESHPMLVSLSGERLARERHYDGQDRERVLAEFISARRHTLAVLRSVEAGEWARVGTFEGYGEVTLGKLVEIMVEHDAGHRSALLGLPRA